MGEIFSADEFLNIGNQPEKKQGSNPRVRPTSQQPVDSQEYYDAEPRRRRPQDPRAINLPPMSQPYPQPRRTTAPGPQAAPRPRQQPRLQPDYNSDKFYDAANAMPPRQNPNKRKVSVSPEKKDRAKIHLSRKAIAVITIGSLAGIGVGVYAADAFGIRSDISHAAADIGKPAIDHDPHVNVTGLSYRGDSWLALPTSPDKVEGSCLAEDEAILYTTVTAHMPLIPNLPPKATAANAKPTAQPVSRYLTGKNGDINIDPSKAEPVDPKKDPNDVEGNLLFQIENDKSLSAAKKTATEKVLKDFWAKSDNGYPEATINNMPLALHVCETGNGGITTTKDSNGNITGIAVNRSELTVEFLAPPVRSALSQTDGVDNAVNNLQQKQGQYETFPAPGYNLFLQQGAESTYDSTELGNLVTALNVNKGADYASEVFVQMETNAVQQLAAERNNPAMFGGAPDLQTMTDQALTKVLAQGNSKVSIGGGSYKFAAGDASSVVNKATVSATAPKDLYLQDLSMQGQPDTKIFEFDSAPKVRYGYFVQPKVTSPTPTPTATSTPKPTTTPTK